MEMDESDPKVNFLLILLNGISEIVCVFLVINLPFTNIFLCLN